jgi:predicted DNA-binding antitoxin AbrB/MazE fold protein
MQTQAIEAVFENGVFRPVQPVELPEHQRVTLLLTADEEAAADAVGFEPLPLQERTTIRVRVKKIGLIGPVVGEPAEVEEE